MKCNYTQSAACLQQVVRPVDRPRKPVKLPVDLDADGLKSPPCGVLRLVAKFCRDGPAYELGQLCRRFDRILFPIVHNAIGDSLRKALLAVLVENARKLLFGIAVDNVEGGERRGPVHAHIERRVGFVRKAPLRRIELVRGNAEVEQDAVDLSDADTLQQRLHFKKIAVQRGETFAKVGKPRACRSERLPVPVDADEPARFRQTLEHRLRVSAAAKRAVHKNAAATGKKQRNHLVEQHRDMMKLHG